MTTIILIIAMVLGAVLSAVALSKSKVRMGIAGVVLLAGAGLGLHLSAGVTPWVLVPAGLAALIALPWATNPQQQGKRGRIITSLALAAIAALIATPAAFATASASSGSGKAPQVVGNAKQDLTVHEGDLAPASAKCTTDEFNDNSRKPVGTGANHRLWVDSDSTPLTTTEKGAQYDELVNDICGNPTLGHAYAQALGDAQIGSFSVAKANPWLSDFLQESNGKDGLRTWLTYKENHGKTIYVTGTSEGKYQYYAQMINTLIGALDNQGTKTAPSTVNWPLGAMTAGNLPRAYKATGKDEQENLPFVAFTFTQKGGDKCPYVLGMNVKDKRPENVSCKTATKVAPPTPTKPRPGTHTPTPSTTPTKPGSTPTPTPSHSTPGTCMWKNGTVHHLNHGLCPKDPSVIPSNPNHTPAGHPTLPASSPSHPAEAANPSTKPGSGSTQQAPGASPTPHPSASAPPAGNPTSTASACIPDPDTGKGC